MPFDWAKLDEVHRQLKSAPMEKCRYESDLFSATIGLECCPAKPGTQAPQPLYLVSLLSGDSAAPACSFHVLITLRGPSPRFVMSIFRQDNRADGGWGSFVWYATRLERNVGWLRQRWPTWRTRLYLDDSVPPAFVRHLVGEWDVEVGTARTHTHTHTHTQQTSLVTPSGVPCSMNQRPRLLGWHWCGLLMLHGPLHAGGGGGARTQGPLSGLSHGQHAEPRSG
jgi:hypothetical protein